MIWLCMYSSPPVEAWVVTLKSKPLQLQIIVWLFVQDPFPYVSSLTAGYEDDEDDKREPLNNQLITIKPVDTNVIVIDSEVRC